MKQRKLCQKLCWNKNGEDIHPNNSWNKEILCWLKHIQFDRFFVLIENMHCYELLHFLFITFMHKYVRWCHFAFCILLQLFLRIQMSQLFLMILIWIKQSIFFFIFFQWNISRIFKCKLVIFRLFLLSCIFCVLFYIGHLNN